MIKELPTAPLINTILTGFVTSINTVLTGSVTSINTILWLRNQLKKTSVFLMLLYIINIKYATDKILIFY